MLSRVNRITRAADFRSTVRTGRKRSTTFSVVYLVRRSDGAPTRFGFIVSKAVGNSVVRHRVTRRLRAASFELLPQMSTGSDVIVRALPGIVDADWATLRKDIGSALEQSGARA